MVSSRNFQQLIGGVCGKKKGTSGKWEAFKGVLTRVQGKHIPLRVKGKAGRSRETWMTRDIEALVKKKKEAHDMP